MARGKPAGAEKRGARVVRTSITLPEDLWKAAKIRAVEDYERTPDLAAVIIAALEAYLGRRKGGK
jgi:hypothetical protein